MFWRAIVVLGGLSFVTGGCNVLNEARCASVDLGDADRNVSYECLPANQGDMSASQAEWLMFLGGAMVVIAAWPLIRAIFFNHVAARVDRDEYVARHPGSSSAHYHHAVSGQHTETGAGAPLNGSARDPLAASLAAVLRHVASQDPDRSSVESPGWSLAELMLVAASNDTITQVQAHQMLETASYGDLDPSILDEKIKRLLLKSALEVAFADGSVSLGERASLGRVIQDLWGHSHHTAQQIVSELISTVTAAGDDPERQAALTVMGLSEDATAAEIRSAYLALVSEHHPDRAAPANRAQATDRTAQINGAYGYLIAPAGA